MSADHLPSWFTVVNNPNSLVLKHTEGNVSDPPAFIREKPKKVSAHSGSTVTKKRNVDQDTLKLKKAWEIAIAPAKALPMNVFMSYMSGNSLQMVPITMTVMMFFITPMKQIAAVNNQFEHLKGSKAIASDLLMTKLAYIACNLLAVGAGIWKLDRMGLLPTTRSDWLAWETYAELIEPLG